MKDETKITTTENLVDLPLEILILVLLNLEIPDLLRFSLVSKLCQQLAEHDVIWGRQLAILKSKGLEVEAATSSKSKKQLYIETASLKFKLKFKKTYPDCVVAFPKMQSNDSVFSRVKTIFQSYQTELEWDFCNQKDSSYFSKNHKQIKAHINKFFPVGPNSGLLPVEGIFSLSTAALNNPNYPHAFNEFMKFLDEEQKHRFIQTIFNQYPQYFYILVEMIKQKNMLIAEKSTPYIFTIIEHFKSTPKLSKPNDNFLRLIYFLVAYDESTMFSFTFETPNFKGTFFSLICSYGLNELIKFFIDIVGPIRNDFLYFENTEEKIASYHLFNQFYSCEVSLSSIVYFDLAFKIIKLNPTQLFKKYLDTTFFGGLTKFINKNFSYFQGENENLIAEIFQFLDEFMYSNKKIRFLNHAIEEKYSNIVAYMLNHFHGEKLTKQDYIKLVDGQGRTPLHLAIQVSDTALIEQLLKEEVGLDSYDISGRTPLFMALEGWLNVSFEEISNIKAPELLIKKIITCLGIIELFIQYQPVLTVKNPNIEYKSSLKLGIKDLSLYELFKLQPLSLDYLMKVAFNEKYKMFIQYIIENCDIEYLTTTQNGVRKGDVLLRQIIQYDYVQWLPVLLEKGIDLNAYNDKGETSLHQAAHMYIYNSYDFIGLLLEKGADPNVLNNNGQTPLAIIVRKIESERGFKIAEPLLDLLLKWKADPTLKKPNDPKINYSPSALKLSKQYPPMYDKLAEATKKMGKELELKSKSELKELVQSLISEREKLSKGSTKVAMKDETTQTEETIFSSPNHAFN